jgi:eukaryotic-like serine/threonine-protein kinase
MIRSRASGCTRVTRPYSGGVSLSLGSIVADQYEVIDVLGTGGMATVYKARHLVTDGLVALKVMDAEHPLAQHSGGRFLREARTAARIRHPGIVTVHDAGDGGGTFWLAMELLEGETLRERLARGPLERDEIRSIFMQLVEVLGRVHAANIVHRDLKPENLFLEQLGHLGVRVRLLDFGIAKFLDDDVGDEVGVLGTIEYMAPEQAHEQIDVDHRADIYAFGVMLYECVTGQVPRPAPTLGELLRSLAIDPLVLANLSPGTARARYVDLARDCLAIERTARPADCDALLGRLAEIAQATAVGPAPSEPPVAHADRRRRWPRSALFAVANLAFGAWVVVAQLHKNEPPPAPTSIVEPKVAPQKKSRPSLPPPLPLPSPPAAASAPELHVDVAPPMAVPPAQSAPPARAVASRPSAALAAKRATATQSLAPAQLAPVVRRDAVRLQHCYEDAVRAGGDASRRVRSLAMRVSINRDGTVSHLDLGPNDFGGMQACIEGLAFRWRFPRAPASTDFVVPLQLDPGT